MKTDLVVVSMNTMEVNMNFDAVEKEIKDMSKGDFSKLQAMVYAREKAQRDAEMVIIRKKLHIGSVIAYMGKEGKKYFKVVTMSADHVSFEVVNGNRSHRRTIPYEKILEVVDKMPDTQPDLASQEKEPDKV